MLLGRKAVSKLDSALESKDITLLTKVHLVKGLVFPVVMYRCESWTKMNRTDKILALVDPTLRSLQVTKCIYCEF